MPFFNCAFAAKNPEAITLFKVGGGLLSVIFFTFERALDHNLSHYWDTIKVYVGEHDAFISNRSNAYRMMVPISTHGLFILAFVFWVLIAERYYPCVGLLRRRIPFVLSNRIR